MTVSDADRRELYDRLVVVLGQRAADTLIELVQPSRGDFDTRMAESRADVHARMGESGADFHARMAKSRADFHTQVARHCSYIDGLMAKLMAVNIATSIGVIVLVLTTGALR